MPAPAHRRPIVPSQGPISRLSGLSQDDLVSQAVRDHLDVMLAAARLLLRSDDLAWDAVQESLQALWKQGSIETPLRGWLLRTVRHRAFQLLRSERRRRHHEAACACLLCLVAEDDTARQLEDSELLDLARRAVESLPTAYRTVIEMRDWRGMDYQSIATELGVPVGTVRSRLSRARDHVRALVRRSSPDRRPCKTGERPAACTS